MRCDAAYSVRYRSAMGARWSTVLVVAGLVSLTVGLIVAFVVSPHVSRCFATVPINATSGWLYGRSCGRQLGHTIGLVLTGLGALVLIAGTIGRRPTRTSTVTA